MKRWSNSRSTGSDDPNQLLIDWTGDPAGVTTPEGSTEIASSTRPTQEPPAVTNGAVESLHPDPVRKRFSSALPVRRPLPSAIRAAAFGTDECGPIRPGNDEVREITQQHADKLIDFLGTGDEKQFRSGLAKYAEDFGTDATSQLERYARRQVQSSSR